MKTISIMIVSLFFALASGCKGQTKAENSRLAETKKATPLLENSGAKPQIDVKVNRQYDDKGHIVRFDSTYSYIYSSPQGSMHLSNDSVFKSFRSFFGKSYPDLMDRLPIAYSLAIHYLDTTFLTMIIFKSGLS